MPTEQADVDGTEPQRAPIPTVSAKPKRWLTATKVASALVAVVGAATGVFSVTQVMTRDVSSVDTLRISASPVSAGEREFALPLRLLRGDDFPQSAQVCGAEQLQWLHENARPLDRRLRIDMRNMASEGAMLALVDFRSHSQASASAPPTHVLFSCPIEATVSVSRAAQLRVDVHGDTARFRPLPNAQSGSIAPDVPVSWNLAPGESGIVDIKVTAQANTAGNLMVTVLSGRTEADVVIEDSDFELPGLWRHGDVYLTVDEGGLQCLAETPQGPEECTDSDVAALINAHDSLVGQS